MTQLREILEKLHKQQLSVEDALNLVKIDYLDKLDQMAQLDLFRQVRTGIPEVIFAETKSIDQVFQIIQKMLERNHCAILTRVRPNQFKFLDTQFSLKSDIDYQPNYDGKVLLISDNQYISSPKKGTVGLITAGTSDIPVAEETKIVLEFMGVNVMPVYDVGIAGMHRIFPPLQSMLEQDVDAFVVVAGMEGTLPGVVSALVDRPVIGVPTSTGYGLGEKGKGALTTMLQSCSPGLAVVNIDNGFGAATFAALIIKNKYKSTESEKNEKEKKIS